MRSWRVYIGLSITLLFLLLRTGVAAQTPFPKGELSVSRQADPAQLEVGEETEVHVTLTPEEIECITTHPADVVMLIDTSTSMDHSDKIVAARDTARQFADSMNYQADRVAVVAFARESAVIQSLSSDKENIKSSIAGLSTSTLDGSETNIDLGLREALRVFDTRRAQAMTSVVLLSDGESDYKESIEAASELKSQGIEIFSVSLGAAADQSLMSDLASDPTNVHHYHAPTSSDLATIYESIQQQIQAGIIEDITITLTYDKDRLELIPQSITPSAEVEDDTLVWSISTLKPNEAQVLRFRVRARQQGEFPASPSAHADFEICDGQVMKKEFGEDAIVSVLLPSTPTPFPPCQTDPLGDECISTITCLGPLSLPCTSLGLPWWVCLLLLLLLVFGAVLWLLWRQLEQQRQEARAHPQSWPGLSSPSSVGESWPFPRPPDIPNPVAPTPKSTNVQPPTCTLVIGIGGSGSGVIQALENSFIETYDSVPETIRSFSVDLQGEASSLNKLELSLDQTVMNLVEENSRTQEPLPIQDWFPDNTSLNLQNHVTGRALRRLMLFVNLRQVKARIGPELRDLQRQPGNGLTVYIVGSLSGLTGSSLLADLAHLTRLKARDEGLEELSIQAILLLPEAHVAQVNLTEQAKLRQVAAASWRELNRFQSVFEHPYPITYLDEKTVRRGKLFERVYLVGPDQQNASGLRNVPLQSGLYPAIADVIVSLSDPVVHPAWEEVARATDTRLNEKQQRYQEPLYRSLGSFTYILPVEDLLERLALRFTEDLVESLRQGHLDNPEEAASSLLAQPVSPEGMPNTQLISSAARMSQLSREEALAYANEQGLKLTNWLSVVSEDAQQKEARETVYDLAKSGILQCVLTSDVVRASDYGSDTHRVFEKVNDIFDKIGQVKLWLKQCQSIQDKTLDRLVEEYLTTLLNPSSDEFQGLGVPLDFLRALNTLLEEYYEVVAATRSKREQQVIELKKKVEAQRKNLEEAARKIHTRHPTYAHAVLRGVTPAAALTLILGGLSSITAGFSLSLGALALVGSGVGAWFSHRQLFHSPALIRLQKDYLAAEQEHLSAEVELALYQSWENVAKGWQEAAARGHETFTAWDQNLQALVDSRLPKLRKSLDDRREVRDSIPVRRYLDDQDLETMLYQRFFDAKVLDEAQERVSWHRDKGTWNLQLSSTEVSQFQKDTFDEAGTAILELAKAYASRVRSLHIADILAEWFSSQDLAEEAGAKSEPFIRIQPHLQPESENCRMIAVQSKSQREYFDQVTAMLRESAAQIHTERLVGSAYPHRCGIIASLDVLHLDGLPSWKKALESYTHTRSKKRSSLHIFPAEANAATWESLMPRVNLQSTVLAPSACLVLENERRALAFLRALALEWIEEYQETRSGLRRYHAITLTLPESGRVMLTSLKEKPPSLWTAATSFILAHQIARSDPLTTIESAWRALIEPPNSKAKRVARNQLESALEKAARIRESSNQRIAELGLLLQLVVEDGLNRLYGEEALLT